MEAQGTAVRSQHRKLRDTFTNDRSWMLTSCVLDKF